MSEKDKRSVSTPKLAGIALVLGALAGAGAVYVSHGVSGNPPSHTPAQEAGAPVQSDAQCQPARRVAQALTKYTSGDVAAMTTEDRPRLLGDLTFKDAEGKTTSLAAYRGRTLLVNIWATWCVPCRAEMPALDRLEAAKGGNQFEVVAVNIDTGDPDKPGKFLKQIGVGHVPLHRDPTMNVFNDLKKEGLAFGLPVTLLVGKDSCLLAAMNGPAAWDGTDAAKLVDAAIDLQKAPTSPSGADAASKPM